MKRREFISLVGGAAAIWPLAAQAQRRPMSVIGYLALADLDEYPGRQNAFRQGLSESGYAEGENVTIEYRWADGHNERLRALAADLVSRKVALIVATPGPAALAVKAETATIPTLFHVAADPINLGLVASLNRPGGNFTGVTQLAATLVPKRLEMLHKLVPDASVVAVLADPQGIITSEQITSLRQAAQTLGLRLLIENGRDIDSVSAHLAQQKVDALFVTASSYYLTVLTRILLLASRYNLPAIYESRDYTTAGGLVSYGVDFLDVYRQIGIYAGKILTGVKPGDLPVTQPTKFELVINLKTARALGLEVPPSMLAIADGVIE